MDSWFDLDPRVKPEDDIVSVLTSPLRGRRKENNPVNCFLTTGAELLICDPAAATEANVTVAADRSKLVLLSPQHLRSQTVAERSDAGEGEKGKAGFALPGPLIYERVTNLKIP